MQRHHDAISKIYLALSLLYLLQSAQRTQTLIPFVPKNLSELCVLCGKIQD